MSEVMAMAKAKQNDGAYDEMTFGYHGKACKKQKCANIIAYQKIFKKYSPFSRIFEQFSEIFF